MSYLPVSQFFFLVEYLLLFKQKYIHLQRSSRSRAPPAPARRPMSTAPPARKPAAAPPAPAPAAHPPAPMMQQQPASGGGMFSGIGSTIVQGMAFGTGSAIAHRAVGAVADSFSGSGSNEAAPAAAPEYAPTTGQFNTTAPASNDACSMDKTNFYDCLQQNKGDQMACNFLYEQLKSCQQNSQMQFS
jgi:coiled-coil-helix-coiled-coil-helix domain-containing protein 10